MPLNSQRSIHPVEVGASLTSRDLLRQQLGGRSVEDLKVMSVSGDGIEAHGHVLRDRRRLARELARLDTAVLPAAAVADPPCG